MEDFLQPPETTLKRLVWFWQHAVAQSGYSFSLYPPRTGKQ